MKGKIRAEKAEGGWKMVCILPHTDEVEYPQEGLIHPTRADVYRDAEKMYAGCPEWAYDPRNHTIKID